ncbi:MAG: hypothetical protein E7450_06525 [Ruminococcaceae bacterium]|nr:hypothetical protein [Oscillospiraceae bacterium]
MYILGSIILLIVGVLMLCFPDGVYAITESWKAKASNGPSRLYRIHIRVGGGVFVLVGVLGLVANIVW